MSTRALSRQIAGLLFAGLATAATPAAAQELANPGSFVALPPLPAVDARAPQPSRSVWRDLLFDTAGDLRRVPSQQTVGWLALGTFAAAGTLPADPRVGRSLSGARMLDEPLEPGAVLGSTPLQLGLSAAAYGIGRAIGRPRMAQVGADLFRAELLAQGVTMGMKEAIRRRRPEGSGFAFPSGHTTVSFASATVLQRHFGWRAGLPAYALASYVALSRVQMQRHHLSDVAFGAALGIALGRTVVIGREHKVRVEPMMTASGAGVQFNWLGRIPVQRR